MTNGQAAESLVAPPRPHSRGLDLVARRTMFRSPIELAFPLAPGDRPLVATGDMVVAGTTIAERLRDPQIVELPAASSPGEARPGDRWMAAGHAATRTPGRHGSDGGELVYQTNGHWAIATGEHAEPVDCPVTGVVRDVRPGIGIRIEAQGRMLSGIEALGDPTRGRLSLGSDFSDRSDTGDQGHDELRSTSLHVGLSGTVLVISSRVDAEALTRARAMGVRGVIVSGLAGKERRDFIASEARQRAALQKMPPFAVLILDGVLRRPIAGPIAALLERLAGTTVAISVDPPGLIFDEPDMEMIMPPADHVRVRSGEHAGEEGRWAGVAGIRRFAGGVYLEAGWVVVGDDAPFPVAIADLERFD